MTLVGAKWRDPTANSCLSQTDGHLASPKTVKNRAAGEAPILDALETIKQQLDDQQ